MIVSYFVMRGVKGFERLYATEKNVSNGLISNIT